MFNVATAQAAHPSYKLDEDFSGSCMIVSFSIAYISGSIQYMNEWKHII